MNKAFSIIKLNRLFLVLTLFIVGIAFFIPNYVIGSKKMELTAKPRVKDVKLSWETSNTRVEEFVITRTAVVTEKEDEEEEEEKEVFYVKGNKNSFVDTKVEQRTAYSYKVTAKRNGKIIEESNVIENVILAKADNPHGMYSEATSLCSTCHQEREKAEGQTEAMAQAELCFSCHGDLEEHFADVKISGSAHPVMNKDTALKCTDCHNPHKTADEANPAILKFGFKLKDESVLKLTVVNDEFCFACHNSEGTSSKLIDKETYQTNNYHSKPIALAESETISCNNCHVSHASEFKSLLKFEFNPFSNKKDINNNQLCFSCHGDNSKTNILKLYNGNKDGESKGHYIKNQDLAKSLDLPVGWKLSCADCHSTHGSKNDTGISDKLGDFTDISDPIKKERAICSSCHAYSNESDKKSIFRGVFFAPLPDTVEQHSAKPNGEIQSCSSCHGNNDPVLGAHAPKSNLTPPTKIEDPKESEKDDKPTEPSVEEPSSNEPVTPDKGDEPSQEPAEKVSDPKDSLQPDTTNPATPTTP